MSERKTPRFPAEPETLPCGHDAKQAAWLGCTRDCCREGDARIAAEYRATHPERE